jgi:hypothetical protein
MNILAALFGIFRRRGLVITLKEGRSLRGYTLSAIVLSIVGGVLYGFAMGVGLGIETAVKDAVKIGLIFALTLLISIPIFWVAYRLLGREDRPGQVAAVPLTLAATVALILTVTAPIVFMLSVLVGISPEAVYIHVVIVDVAILIGLFLSGTLINHSFSDKKQLVIPNVIGFLMMGVVLVVLMSFFTPYLVPSNSFSVGTDRMKDGLGIGVAKKVEHALKAAKAADRVSYRFQTTNENGDLTRDYWVSRVGNDYRIDIGLHAVPLETTRGDQHIWIIDGEYFTDFNEGRVGSASHVDLVSFLDPALPEAAFSLPADLYSLSWRAYERAGQYSATGTDSTQQQSLLVLETSTGRLATLTQGSAEVGLLAEVRVREIAPVDIDRAALEASLNQAIVLGSVDRSNASFQDYVQAETFFAVRYPRDWRVGTWSPTRRDVEFANLCGRSEGCPAININVFDHENGKGAKQYAEDLARSLGFQPEYREINIQTVQIGGEQIGVVEYLYDRTVKGELETTEHTEYIFLGQIHHYHLDFSAPKGRFEVYRDLFEEIADLFTYLK